MRDDASPRTAGHGQAWADVLSTLAGDDPATQLAALVAQGADQLPLPASGNTLARWQALAAVGAHSLGLAKLYDGHTDALAILAELQMPDLHAGQRWAVWCAEPAGQPLAVVLQRPGSAAVSGTAVSLTGCKPWCSGAATTQQALVSGWLPDGQRCLVAVDMAQPGIGIDTTPWQAVGMSSSASATVRFAGAAGVLVGAPGAYLARPGFIHGGVGVAACWYVRDAAVRRDDPYRWAHLGAMDVALSSAASLMREAAAAMDRTPLEPCLLLASRARLAVEAAAEELLRRVPRALGAGPLCQDRPLAQLMADLPVFIRQSHAERDLAALGHLVADNGNTRTRPWQL